ncbi:uncharacterized [Tachysurus ichikawai]
MTDELRGEASRGLRSHYMRNLIQNTNISLAYNKRARRFYPRIPSDAVPLSFTSAFFPQSCGESSALVQAMREADTSLASWVGVSSSCCCLWKPIVWPGLWTCLEEAFGQTLSHNHVMSTIQQLVQGSRGSSMF